jgi:hypothetical protein
LSGTSPWVGGVLPDEVGEVCSEELVPYDESLVQAVIKPTGDINSLIKDREQQVVIYEGVREPGEFVSCTFIRPSKGCHKARSLRPVRAYLERR